MPTNTNWPADRRDRPFFAAMLVAVWLVIVSGFGAHNLRKYAEGTFGYPWIVHVHALVFTAWLILFTAQMIFVRRGAVATHRRIGLYGAGLAAAMVILGLITAIWTEQLKLGTAASDAPFLAVMFSDMIVFAGLVTAGISMRGSPHAHKRLMLLATIMLTVAGFARWLSPAIGAWLGTRNFWEIKTFAEGGWPFIRFQLLPAYTLVAAVGVFDLVTRGRLHPVYVRAVACTLPVHVLAGWLYFQPFWRAMAAQMAGR